MLILTYPLILMLHFCHFRCHILFSLMFQRVLQFHLGPVTDAQGGIKDGAFGAFKAILLELTGSPQIRATEKLRRNYNHNHFEDFKKL